MRPEDVYQLTGVSDPGCGRAVTRSPTSSGRSTARRTSTASRSGSRRPTAPAPPRRLTSGDNDAQPRWSPDGDRLAFVAKRGDEKARRQLYVMPMGGGEAQSLTDLKEDVGEAAWSPDGTKIVFSARVPHEAYEEEDDKKRAPRRFTRLLYKLDSVGWTGDRRRHLYVVPADGSAEAKQITDGDFEDAHPTWTPDGKSIAFSSARNENWDIELKGDIYVVPADGGEPTRLTPNDARVLRAELLAGREAARRQVGRRRLRLPAPHADRGDRRVGRELPRPDRVARPHLRPLPGDPGADLGRRARSSSRSRTAATSTSTASRRTAASPSSSPAATSSLTGFDAATARVARTGSTAPNLGELYVGETQLTEIGKEFGARARARARRSASRPSRRTGRRSRPGSPAPPASRRARRYPAPAQHPRRPVHAVRQRLLRRVPGVRRAAATPSSTRTRAARRATPRSGAARSWARASSAPAGARSTTRT